MGSSDLRNWSGQGKAVLAERQGAKARFCGSKDRVGDSGQKSNGTDFTNAAQRASAAANQVDFHGRHFGHANDGVIVIIALHGAAAVEGDFRFEGTREAPSDSAFE